MTTRKHYDSRFKAQIALEALKNQKTIAQIASEHGVNPNLVTQWKQRLLAEIPDIFSNKQQKSKQDSEALQDELYRQIGQLKVRTRLFVLWLSRRTGAQKKSGVIN